MKCLKLLNEGIALGEVRIKVKSNFDLDTTGYRFAIRPESRFHFPGSHRFQCTFIKARAQALEHDWLRYSALCRDGDIKQHHT